MEWLKAFIEILQNSSFYSDSFLQNLGKRRIQKQETKVGKLSFESNRPRF